MHTIATRHGEVARAAGLPTASFVVGEWLVEPDLSRVSRKGHAEHVRPQLIDVLVYLARNTGRTVPQSELLAQVWPGQPYVTETALPRCIAELRRTFGDSASGPTMIQTVPKRGYRLIATVVPAADGPSAAGAAALPPPQPHPLPPSGHPVLPTCDEPVPPSLQLEATSLLTRAWQATARAWRLLRPRAI